MSGHKSPCEGRRGVKLSLGFPGSTSLGVSALLSMNKDILQRAKPLRHFLLQSQ